MGNLLKTAAGVASVIPGPHTPWAAGASALLGAMDSNANQSAGNQALASSNQLTQEQIKMLQQLNPQLLANAKDAQNQYAQYDPAADTERAMVAFDEAANESAARDYGNARTSMSLRGLQGSSEAAGAQKQVAAQRSTARGQLKSELTLGERSRKQGALSFANSTAQQALGGAGSYQQPIGNLGNMANLKFGQAASYDPTGQIQQFGDALKNFKFPWMKKVKVGTPPFNPDGAQE